MSLRVVLVIAACYLQRTVGHLNID